MPCTLPTHVSFSILILQRSNPRTIVTTSNSVLEPNGIVGSGFVNVE